MRQPGSPGIWGFRVAGSCVPKDASINSKARICLAVSLRTALILLGRIASQKACGSAGNSSLCSYFGGKSISETRCGTLIGRKIKTVKTDLFQPHRLYQSWRAVVARRCFFSSLMSIKDAAVSRADLRLQVEFPLFSLATARRRNIIRILQPLWVEAV